MRYVLAVAIAGMAMPSTVAGQALGPRTLLPMHVLCADMPVTALPGITLTIEGAQHPDGRQALGIGDVAVVRAGTGDGIKVGDRFMARRVLRPHETLIHRRGPYDDIRSDYDSVHTAGVLTVFAVDERFALARVESACDTVQVGDYLEPVALPTLPTPTEAGGTPNFDDRALVLIGLDQRKSFGDGDILTINRGSSHGVTPGARFAIYRDPGQGLRLPLVAVADAVVVEVSEAISKAVVVRVVDGVRSGDVAVPVGAGPARP
ncbi:MAG: hypothetical protein AB7Q16_08795 [Vicinamibacterales bacterium]